MEIKTKNDYDRLIDMLFKMSSGADFIMFAKKTVNTSNEIIGVRAPELRSLAKKISKVDHEGLFKYGQNRYYEEILLRGLVIAFEKDFKMATKLLDEFYINIDNWAIVDMVACGLSFVKNVDKKISYNYFKGLLKSDHEFTIRFGVVCLMKYFLEEEYIDDVILALAAINCDKYYVSMAIAWLMSELLIKNPQNALENMQKIIKINHFNAFVINKSIQKACESYRIDMELKNKLKGLKIKC